MRRKSSRASVHESDIELPLIDQQSSQNTGQQPGSHFTQYFSSESSAMKYIKDMPFIKLVTFFDTFLFARAANRKHGSLQTEDLPLPFYFCNVEEKIIALDIEWSKELTKPKPSIVLAIMRAFKKESLIIGLLGFLYVNTSLFRALLTGSIIENVTASNFGDPLEQETMLFKASVLGVTTIIGIFFDTWYWHLAALTAMRIRNTIIGLSYKKLQSVALSSVQEINIGKVINLLSNDINDVDKGLMYVIPLLLSPYTIGICGFFIWEFFEYTTIFGIVGLGLLLALSNFVSNKTESVRIEKNAFTDERIKLTNELIEGIRLIKMYAWEKAFKRIIEGLREKEAIKVIRLKTLDSIGQSFSFSSAQICLMIMCVMYTINGGILSPKKVYTTFMILNFVRVWGVSFFHFGAMFIANSRVIKTRVEEVLRIKDVLNYEETIRRYSHATGKSYQGDSNPTKSAHNQTTQSKGKVVFENFTAWWKKDSNTPCLENIDLTLNPGEITTVIGTIGSGKTSFLLSFLREIPSVRGNLYFKGKVAYVEQEPIIFPGTVRSNILFGLDYNEELYKKVIRACNLREDFKQFESGDKTLVGERGITLSGGQKARVSLARALYSQSDIYLLDDPLSAVDSRVGRHIFNNAVKSDLLKDKVVVLVTHHLTYAKEADRVLLFEGGRIIGDGTFESLKSLDNNLLTMFKEVEEEKIELLRKQSSMRASEYEPNQEAAEEKKPETGEGDVQVTWSTYINYAKQANDTKFLIMVILFYFGSSISAICFARVTGYWGQVQNAYYFDPNENPDLTIEKEPYDNTIFIFLTIFIVILILFFDVTKTVSTYKFLLKANTNMHQNMLQRIVRATVLFFDTTPIGTILNRFSNDIGVLDGSNAPILCDVVEGGIYISWMMITLIAISVILLFPCLIVFLLLIKLRRFFQKPVMETKRLDLSSRSPLYSEISTTINGLLAIRVYQQGGNFIRRFCDLLLNNSRAFLYMERTVRFFAYTLNLILDSLSVIGTFIFIFVAQYTNLEASLFGLALVMLQEISGMGSWMIRMSLMLDINMQSVERILKYNNLPQEPPEHVPDENNQLYYYSNNEWPQKGQIEFNNVYMKYRPEFDYVLQGLTFNIPGGCKIGVVGRTGAGKSSILQVLFRMVDLDTIPGSYVKIDGADISKIGIELLRKNLAIIPQNPVIFTGKIRRNLDPFGEFRESQLWDALEEVNLKAYVSSLSKKLDTDMTLSTSVFSAGQKQLVCLARAILRKTKILVLDEATANVDIETDDFIQKKIMERFRDCTVITIAHRLITIANYDKVLVMDKGRAVEYDSPYMLMAKKEGDKEITSDGIFADMVKKSGESMSRKIFEISSAKYFGDKKGQKEY